MALYLCVDCGGSKTSAVICDGAGKVVGRAYGGPSNFAYLTLEDFVSAVRLTVSDALKTSSTPPSIEPVPLPPAQPIAAAWFGISGVDSPSAITTITPVLSALLGIPEGPRLIIGNDTQLLASPLRMHPDISHAVTVVAGTGSITVSFENVGGRFIELGRVGGWGWILGDEGGGFHVGREAVRQILIQHDTASVSSSPLPESTLRTLVLKAFSVTSVPEVLPALHMPDAGPLIGESPDAPAHLTLAREKRLSTLAPLVFLAALQDADPLALNVLRTCAGVLASEIVILLGERSDEQPRLVKAQDAVISFGGSLVGIEAYRKMILDDLASRGHRFRYVEVVEDAATIGAVSLSASFQEESG